VPVLVAARRRPDLEAIRRALLDRVPGGLRKWRLIEAAGPMEAVGGIWLQRAGLGVAEAAAAVACWQLNGKLPEPLRTAHLIAGGVSGLPTRQRA